jgi:hypothetical protein
MLSRPPFVIHCTNSDLKKVGYSGSTITGPILLQEKEGKVFPAHAMMAHMEAEVLVHSLLTSTPIGGKRSA